MTSNHAFTQEDFEFLKEAVICVNDVNQRKEWRCKEENLSRLIELSNIYGNEVVYQKIQEIKEMYED
jgi:hypothetical protein